MRVCMLCSAALLAIPIHPGPVHWKLPTAIPNDNTRPAGQLGAGVLRLDLEAKLARWHPDGDSLPGIAVEAFGEPGRRPQVPGPLVRVPRGTEIRASVRNSLVRDTVTFHFPAADSLVIPPGQRRALRVRAATPGTFLYRATTSTPLHRRLQLGGLLAGAVVVDSVSARGPARDRVFVILVATDSADPVLNFPSHERSVRSINGLSWPHTERLRATVGDTLHWRVINVGNDVHPMHLHGFYFRVDQFDGPRVGTQGQGPPGRWVVTERMSQFSTMSLTWSPERAGNWLFHCHFQKHLVPHGEFNVTATGVRQRIAPAAPEGPVDSHANHALTGMAGLVMGIEVRPRPGERIAEPGAGHRLLRLVATAHPAFPDSAPLMRYLPDGPTSSSARGMGGTPAISPTLYLTRGEPVAITVVNHLREPTAIHWHGIELESYFDGVAGFSGFGPRLTPIIAPSDSFVARFTPPRSGTFIYHSHVDEPRQHRAGLVGALVVRDSAPADPTEDLVFFLKSARERSDPTDPVPFEINGVADPDTLVLRAGRTYRMRFIGLQVRNPSAGVRLTARPDSAYATVPDSLVVRWRPIAKDGADLPMEARLPRPAEQIVSMGETYDFEFVPEQRGNLRLEVRTPRPGRLVVRAPIRVE